MNYIDLAILAIIAFFTIRGLFRGLISETVGLVGIVVSLVVAIKYLKNVSEWLEKFLDIPSAFIAVIAFVIVFVALQIGFQILSFLLRRLANLVLMSSVDKFAGGALGLLKGAVVASLLLLLISVVPFGPKLLPNPDKSILYKPMKGVAPRIYDLITTMVPGSKSFYTEVKESVDRSTRKIGKNTNGFLESFDGERKSSKK